MMRRSTARWRSKKHSFLGVRPYWRSLKFRIEVDAGSPFECKLTAARDRRHRKSQHRICCLRPPHRARVPSCKDSIGTSRATQRNTFQTTNLKQHRQNDCCVESCRPLVRQLISLRSRHPQTRRCAARDETAPSANIESEQLQPLPGHRGPHHPPQPEGGQAHHR